MIIAGIETSGRAGSVALVNGNVLLAERELSATGRRHARTLVPELQSLLRSHGIAPVDVTAVAVSIGPGSFTGLRVGVVCAKTLAYALQCQLVAVDTFLAIAQAHVGLTRVVVMDDALRGDLCVGEYSCVDSTWFCDRSPSLMPLDKWKAQADPGVTISGPAVTKFADELSGFPSGPEVLRRPQARHVAQLAAAQLAAGKKPDDPWTLEPFYMRRSAAEEKADQAAQPDAKG